MNTGITKKNIKGSLTITSSSEAVDSDIFPPDKRAGEAFLPPH